MKLNYYATFDKVAECYSDRPFVCPNDQSAVRAIKANQRHDKDFNLNASDYELHCVGSWNKETGEMLTDKRKVIDLKYIQFDENGMEIRG